MNCFVDQIQRLRVKTALQECSFQFYCLHQSSHCVRADKNIFHYEGKIF